MKKHLLFSKICSLLIALGATSFNTAAAADSMQPLTLSGKSPLAVKSESKHIDAVPLNSPDDKPDGVAPAHFEFHLAPSNATIYLFPLKQDKLSAAEFRKLYPTVADAGTDIRNALKAPALKAKVIPYLPWQDASTPFQVHRKTLKFSTGNASAIRYIAEYLIEPDVIDSARLIYTAQGISNDGKWYVAVVAPLKTKSLPAQSDIAKWPRAAADKFSKRFDSYGKKVGEKLQTLPEGSYTPSLSSLDALVQSIQLH